MNIDFEARPSSTNQITWPNNKYPRFADPKSPLEVQFSDLTGLVPEGFYTFDLFVKNTAVNNDELQIEYMSAAITNYLTLMIFAFTLYVLKDRNI